MNDETNHIAVSRQWLGDTPEDAERFIVKYFPSVNILWEKDEEHGIVLKVSDQGKITTARWGDYIVYALEGYYACPKEAFEKTRDQEQEVRDRHYTIRILGSEYAVARRDMQENGSIMGQIDNMTREITLQADMGKAGMEKWMADTLPRLDAQRTFGDAEPREIPGKRLRGPGVRHPPAAPGRGGHRRPDGLSRPRQPRPAPFRTTRPTLQERG